MPNTETDRQPHKRITYYAGRKIKSYDAHYISDLHPRSLHPRTVIDLDDQSHFTVKKFDGFETGEEYLIDRLDITRDHHTRFVCAFNRTSNANGLYNYQVWSPKILVGNIWGVNIDSFDLVIAKLFHTDSEIEKLTQGAGMDKSVEDLIRQAAIHNPHK